jgi:pyruvate/2-oxoglutarate dehydrogenase complex dihydrolipoamide acyltransferase (E2) component
VIVIKSIAQSKDIIDVGTRARDGKYQLMKCRAEHLPLQMKTSLMSTPILNAPQSTIAGMHKSTTSMVMADGSIEARR